MRLARLAIRCAHRRVPYRDGKVENLQGENGGRGVESGGLNIHHLARWSLDLGLRSLSLSFVLPSACDPMASLRPKTQDQRPPRQMTNDSVLTLGNHYPSSFPIASTGQQVSASSQAVFSSSVSGCL